VGREWGGRRGYEIQRAGIFNRLVDEERIGLIDAEDWLRTWEAKAESIGRPQESQDFWVEGWRWITGELAAKRREAP
jgi:hypothetical protein